MREKMQAFKSSIKTAFLPLLTSTLREPQIPGSTTHLKATNNIVYGALIALFTQKVSGPDKINFQIFYII